MAPSDFVSSSRPGPHPWSRVWYDWPRAPGLPRNAEVRRWLADTGSLTARLRQLSGGRLRVQVLASHWGRAQWSESRVLGLPARQQVLVREVILHGAGEPWVYARSILPYSALRGRLRCLLWLRDRPLGGWLFQQPDLRRGPLQVACLAPSDRRLAGLRCVLPELSAAPLPGRRSVFYVGDRGLLVGEVFLPRLLARLSAQTPSQETAP